MPKVVSLKEVADALEMVNQQNEAFLVLETGEILHVSEDDQFELDESDTDAIPEWQREHIFKLREVLGTDRVIRLPSSYDIHELSFMERFCDTVPQPHIRDQLFDAIQGRGAFRMFRSTCERFRIIDDWYAFRRSAFEDTARDWLANNDIAYEKQPGKSD